MENNTKVAMCFHCGNQVPLNLIGSQKGQKLYEVVNNKRLNKDFDYRLYQCPTCNDVSIFGDYTDYPRHSVFADKRLYPAGPRLLPESHMLKDCNCVPNKIIKVYEEIWPLRQIAPIAFVGQIRRLLEVICKDQNAAGRDLYAKIKDLIDREVFPGYFSEMTDLMRHVGNLGAHGENEDIDIWDAELMDDFFKSVVEYVYITPSKIGRLKQRIHYKKNNT